MSAPGLLPQPPHGPVVMQCPIGPVVMKMPMLLLGPNGEPMKRKRGRPSKLQLAGLAPVGVPAVRSTPAQLRRPVLRTDIKYERRGRPPKALARARKKAEPAFSDEDEEDDWGFDDDDDDDEEEVQNGNEEEDSLWRDGGEDSGDGGFGFGEEEGGHGQWEALPADPAAHAAAVELRRRLEDVDRRVRPLASSAHEHLSARLLAMRHGGLSQGAAIGRDRMQRMAAALDASMASMGPFNSDGGNGGMHDGDNGLLEMRTGGGVVGAAAPGGQPQRDGNETESSADSGQ